VPLGHDPVVEPLDRLGRQEGDVGLEASPVELLIVAPAPDAHDQSQGTMLFGQVLESVVVEVAPEPDGSQDEDGPVRHPRAAAVGAAAPIDVLGDGIEQGIPQFGLGVDVLQGFEDGDDLVAAGGIEPDVEDGGAIETQLGIAGDSHGGRPSKIPWLGTRKSAVPREF
jgi:hypothetical protein